MKQIEIGNSGVFLHELMPLKNPAYSPNLYKWLRKNADSLQCTSVAVDDEGVLHLCIGPLDDDWPATVGLYGALGRGASARPSFVIGLKWNRLTVIEGFWQNYKELGRCAIDPEHDMGFINSERWRYSDDQQRRTCKWCEKVTQVLVETERVVIDRKWSNEEIKA